MDRQGKFIGILSDEGRTGENERDSDKVDDIGVDGNGGEMVLGGSRADSLDVDAVSTSRGEKPALGFRHAGLLNAGGEGPRKRTGDESQLEQTAEIADITEPQLYVPDHDAKTVSTKNTDIDTIISTFSTSTITTSAISTAPTPLKPTNVTPSKSPCQNNTPGSDSNSQTCRVSTGEFPFPLKGIPPCDCERMPAACCYCC